MKLRQHRFALALLDWHGGQDSGLYAVGSCMLTAAEHDRHYDPRDYHGHYDGVRAFDMALSELVGLRAQARHPECVTSADETACRRLAARLERYRPAETTVNP